MAADSEIVLMVPTWYTMTIESRIYYAPTPPAHANVWQNKDVGLTHGIVIFSLDRPMNDTWAHAQSSRCLSLAVGGVAKSKP